MIVVLALPVILTSGIRLAEAALVPINPNASQKAQNLLAYLYSLEGNKILSGQHHWLEQPDYYAELINSNIGKYPAVQGYELGVISGQSESQLTSQRQAVVDSAIAWHNAGGIVTMMYHQNKPGTGYCWNGCVQPGISQSEFDTIVTPGTSQYNTLIAELDKAAVYLKQLRDADVPVLWRPYHEMNGGWFWWGKQPNFWKLWDLIYDRYTNYHGLNNLIWVWNANAPNADSDPYSTYFPGTNKVDILAVDIYNNDYQQSYHDDLWTLGQGKVIAIGENGEHPNPSVLSSTQNKYRWFMTWGNFLVDNNTWAGTTNLYNHSYVLTRDEVNIVTDTQAPTAPTNLTSPAKTATSISLSWTASTDNVGVTGYDVYNGSIKVNTANIAGTSYSVTGLSPSTAYTFTVKAKDAAANVSAASNAVTVTTDASGSAAFVKGINMNGGAVTINGNSWLAESAAGLTLSTISRGSTSFTPSPAVDSATNSMLNTVVYHNTNFSVGQTITNGSYQVYVWAMENYTSNYRSFHVKLEGAQVTSSPIGQLTLGNWQRYGPYDVTVGDDALNMELVKVTGDPMLMGMEIYTTGAPTPITTVNDATTGTGLNQFEYSGTWSTSTGVDKYNNDDHYSLTTGSYYQVQFSGTNIAVYASKASHHGIAGISIDGGAETDVDFYAAVRADNTLIWTSPALSSGTHTIKVRVKGTKNVSSSGYVVVADRVVITP
ncbi:glycosyl hydrolase [Cohnella suwonensis]|uniref:Glycosyl hydrolase n=1 Tax=Cohnella suwonensis TaxID=696072 RepID=A0ABW0M093_9BACL